MAADSLEPAYLIVGSDRPKVTRALERLRARVGGDEAPMRAGRALRISDWKSKRITPAQARKVESQQVAALGDDERMQLVEDDTTTIPEVVKTLFAS